MSTRNRRLAIPLTLLALTFAAIGCGGDDEETSVPSISVPTISVPTVVVPGGERTAPTVNTTTTPLPGSDQGSNAKPDPGKPDSPANDLPPPPGSPQEAFERRCNQNPAACG